MKYVKGIIRKIRKIDYRYYILAAITIFFAALILRFPHSVGRLIESLRDLWNSLKYYCCELIEIETKVQATVTELPKMPYFSFLDKIPVTSPFPKDYAEFCEKWTKYWEVWSSEDNVSEYIRKLLNVALLISRAALFVLPSLILVYTLTERYLSAENNAYGEESKALRKWKTFTKKVIVPVKRWFSEFFEFVLERSVFLKIWLIQWAFYFNVFTIGLEFIAYYFYFVVTFDVSTLYVQIYKLILDIWVAIEFVPIFVWLILIAVIFDRIRKNVGRGILSHNEMKNRGFINARPIVYMVCGTMGKKKTTCITDMALSQEVMLRDKALEKLFENDLKLPNFSWIRFECFLKYCMDKHIVYNLATTRKTINTLRYFFEYETEDKSVGKSINRYLLRNYGLKFEKGELLFGYDYVRYGLNYEDKLSSVPIWEILSTYAQLYFIYVIQSSLIISNYAIRVDGKFVSTGNFPRWSYNFFESKNMNVKSRHSHVLDFDTLRLGKKVLKDNPNRDNFEFGVVVITEIGKERGNMIENLDKKKKDESANPKNDLFNSWLKMVRHSATVDKFPFVRVISDEQRPESLGSDCRDLCDIIYIKESSEPRLAMPFFSLAELLYDFVINKFTELYYRYRYNRSDETLPMYFLKNVITKLHRYYKEIYNQYGYTQLIMQVESGTQDGKIKEGKYYLSNKKIYSSRFATDCFSDYFTAKALRSPYGLNDVPEYVTEKATLDELSMQNSYFINDLNAREEEYK